MNFKRSGYYSLLITLTVWCAWYLYTEPRTMSLLRDYWEISLTMAFGSFIAGATSEGGGAIAFPVFTKLLEIHPLDAKIFSLAIQSIGMTAAVLTICLLRIAVEWRVILWASLGGSLGIVAGTIFISPLLPPDLIKMLFTSMIVSFAITLFALNWHQRSYNATLIKFSKAEKLILIFSGFFGGLMSGLVGNGIDIICFSVMVLLFRLSEKVATPTSVVLMAINAVIGFCLYLFVLEGFTVQIQNYWLAAVPVVVVGAPMGVFFCSKLANKTIANILIALILIELISSLLIIPITKQTLIVSLVVLLSFSIVYFVMLKIPAYQARQ